MHMAAHTKRPIETRGRKCDLFYIAFMEEGDCVLDIRLEWDSYDSGYCKTNKFTSVD